MNEPLDSPLLDSTGILWRGVGNTDLLASPAPGSGRRIVAMRISRRIPEALLPRVVEDCLQGARAGIIYASPRESPSPRPVAWPSMPCRKERRRRGV